MKTKKSSALILKGRDSDLERAQPDTKSVEVTNVQDEKQSEKDGILDAQIDQPDTKGSRIFSADGTRK